MIGVLRLLRDIAEGDEELVFISPADRARCKAAFDRGIECILACQIRVYGELTIWCQQHDAKTLAPTSARSYELPSLCSAESADIVLLLMELPEPDDRVRTAVSSAARWFDANKITGTRVQTVTGEQYENGADKVLVDDPSAEPIWARFYDLQTGKPFFCGRDGVKRNSMADIEHERRMGYAWYNTQGNKVLWEYAKWMAAPTSVP